MAKPDSAPPGVILLSAGRGSRMLPLTEGIPKSLLPVGDRLVSEMRDELGNACVCPHHQPRLGTLRNLDYVEPWSRLPFQIADRWRNALGCVRRTSLGDCNDRWPLPDHKL